MPEQRTRKKPSVVVDFLLTLLGEGSTREKYQWKTAFDSIKLDAKEFELARHGQQLPLHERINLRGQLASLREWIESMPETMKKLLRE